VSPQKAVRPRSRPRDGSVTLLDLATGKMRKRIEAHGKPIRSLSYSADGKLLSSASDDGSIVSIAAVALPRSRCFCIPRIPDSFHVRRFTTCLRPPPLLASQDTPLGYYQPQWRQLETFVSVGLATRAFVSGI
jgi:hypothetical protein